MRNYYTLDIRIHANVVTIRFDTPSLNHVGLTLSRVEFEPLVRSPRLFDYIERAYICVHKNTYSITAGGQKHVFDNPIDHPLIREMVTHRFDFEKKVRVKLGPDKVQVDPVLAEKAEKPPEPECFWAHARTRVVLGLDPHMMPPEIIGNIHAVPVNDRTGTIKFVTKKLTTDRPHPDYTVPETRSFEELMLYRAEELWRWIEDDGREAVIWWSGGIDSTGLLVAMLRTSTPTRMQLVKIGFNDRSIKEYPKFYDEVVKKLPSEFISHNDGREIDLTRLHISGEIGDQLFGADMVRACFGKGGKSFIGRQHFEGNAFKPWRDTISPFAHAHLSTREWADYHPQVMEIYEQLCAAAPIEIVTVFDFWWWMNFNLKFTHVSNRIQLGSIDSALARKRIMAFFDTEYFQKWSVANHDKKIKDTWKSYKWPLKQFVFDWNKDREWFTHKTKVESLRMYQDSRNLIMDTKYQRYGRADREALLETYFGDE